jgi:transposase
MGRLVLTLTPAQRRELVRLRDRHPRAYVREQAAAILKVAAGASRRQVALRGLHKPRGPATVGAWVRRYLQQGAAGLLVRPGRGRRPAFSPGAPGRR